MAGATMTMEALVERATDSLLLGPDWDVILQIVELLKSRPRSIPDALATLQLRLEHPDKEVNLRALELLEACVKNCPACHPYVGSKGFLTLLKKIAQAKKTHILVREKLLEMIVSWAHVFRHRQDLSFKQIHDRMVKEGVSFPKPSTDDTKLIEQSRTSLRNTTSPTAQASKPGEQKLEKELRLAQNNIKLLIDMLSCVDPSKEDVKKNDVVQELLALCKDVQPRFSSIVQQRPDLSENLLAILLQCNDQAQTAFAIYEDLLKGIPYTSPEAIAAIVAKEEEQEEKALSSSPGDNKKTKQEDKETNGQTMEQLLDFTSSGNGSSEEQAPVPLLRQPPRAKHALGSPQMQRRKDSDPPSSSHTSSSSSSSTTASLLDEIFGGLTVSPSCSSPSSASSPTTAFSSAATSLTGWSGAATSPSLLAPLEAVPTAASIAPASFSSSPFPQQPPSALSSFPTATATNNSAADDFFASLTSSFPSSVSPPSASTAMLAAEPATNSSSQPPNQEDDDDDPFAQLAKDRHS
ncbi:Hepatocyte growth factor-regulated tyrosine kinase substrate [Balamuthia mandrillaris]